MEQSEVEEEAQPASKEADLQRIFSDFNLDKDGKNSQLYADLLEWKRSKYWAVPKVTEKEWLGRQIKIDKKENNKQESK